jgi:translation initiation factor 3 subunit G
MKIRVSELKVKTPKRVETRRDLPRFGEAKVGEQNVTLISKETIAMEHPDDALIEDKDTALAATLKEFIERKANRDIANDAGVNLADVGDNIFGVPTDAADNKEESGEPKVKKYVPPGALAAAQGISTGVSMGGGSGGEKDTTIRVSNLTKSVCEDDLRDLFGRFGRVVRVALPKTEVMRDGEMVKEPRGFAYITFLNSHDAEQAFNTLQGYGYDHLILKLEWSKPMVRDPFGGGGGLAGSGFVSGYGTKLAQDTKEKIHGYTDQAAHNSGMSGGWRGRD